MAIVLNEYDQSVEGLWWERHGSAIAQQQPLSRHELEWPESVKLIYFLSHLTIEEASAKIQKIFKTGKGELGISPAVGWLTKFLQRDSGANSKSGAHRDQSNWSKKTTRTLEITVESQELNLYQTTSRVDSPVVSNSSFADADGDAGAEEE
jgi:hypothetical protein